MPACRHFFRSPSPALCRQATIASAIHTPLSIYPPRAGRRPKPIEQRRQEPVGARQMVGGVNEAVVVEMFQAYRRSFRLQLNIVGDDDNYQIHRRCVYTREHKLAAIDYVVNTWERLPNGQIEHISRYYAVRRLNIAEASLSRWIRNK